MPIISLSLTLIEASLVQKGQQEEYKYVRQFLFEAIAEKEGPGRRLETGGYLPDLIGTVVINSDMGMWLDDRVGSLSYIKPWAREGIRETYHGEISFSEERGFHLIGRVVTGWESLPSFEF